MRKTICLFLILSLLFALLSCGEEKDAYSMLTDFASAYGVEGIIYSPCVSEGEPGYMREGLAERVFLFSGRFTDNYAVLLNSRTESASECGIFVCPDALTQLSAEEACLERIRLLGGDNGFVKTKGRIVYYSTLKDRDRAERLFSEIIK